MTRQKAVLLMMAPVAAGLKERKAEWEEIEELIDYFSDLYDKVVEMVPEEEDEINYEDEEDNDYAGHITNFGFGRFFITTFNNGFFMRVGSGSFYNSFSFAFLFGISFNSTGRNGLFIENLVYKSLFIKLFGIGDFKLLGNIEQFRNEHVVQLQNVVHNGVLVIKIKKPASDLGC